MKLTSRGKVSKSEGVFPSSEITGSGSTCAQDWGPHAVSTDVPGTAVMHTQEHTAHPRLAALPECLWVSLLYHGNNLAGGTEPLDIGTSSSHSDPDRPLVKTCVDPARDARVFVLLKTSAPSFRVSVTLSDGDPKTLFASEGKNPPLNHCHTKEVTFLINSTSSTQKHRSPVPFLGPKP